MTSLAAPIVPIAYEKQQTLLSIEGVTLQLGGRLILRDVTATIKNITRPDCVQGQVICFLGPSGIGKTRLSRIIAGLDAPTSGRVTLADGVPIRKGLVGMVPQTYPLFEFTSVLQNFLIAGKQAGLSAQAAKQKAQEFIDEFNLGDYLNRYPKELSGGTRQRVAIVRQLMCSEHLLVMDEPFSGLDLIMKERACELVTEVANRHDLNTIVVVTHDVSEGMSVADTVWLMGLERDLAGNFIPGAKLVEEFDLAHEGLCWRPDLLTDQRFIQFVAMVKERFRTLVP